MRWPDLPKLVSPDFLKRIDSQETGRWLGQPKYDGWRRIISYNQVAGAWEYMAKNHSERRELPADLKKEFETAFGKGWIEYCRDTLHADKVLPLDTEWVGPRHKGVANRLYVFDMLADEPFERRALHLENYSINGDSMEIVRSRKNPGLFDFYLEQLQDEYSEGVVVRRADSKIIGDMYKCAENPLWFKVKFK